MRDLVRSRWLGDVYKRQSLSLARDRGPLGMRCNLVAAGPIRTAAAKSIPGFERFEEAWAGRAPLGWDVDDPQPAAQACVALLSDWFPATTLSLIHISEPTRPY